MTLWKKDLFSEMERVHTDFERVLNEMRPGEWRFPFSRISFLPGRQARAYPLINIGEDKQKVYIDALAPGLDTDTLDLSVTGRKLAISGEKKDVIKRVKPEAVHRNERSAGRFARTVSLNADVDSGKVEASYDKGVLSIVLPKTEAAKTRQIKVKMN